MEFCQLKTRGAARYPAKFLGDYGFYDTANISLFYLKIFPCQEENNIEQKV